MRDKSYAICRNFNWVHCVEAHNSRKHSQNQVYSRRRGCRNLQAFCFWKGSQHTFYRDNENEPCRLKIANVPLSAFCQPHEKKKYFNIGLELTTAPIHPSKCFNRQINIGILKWYFHQYVCLWMNLKYRKKRIHLLFHPSANNEIHGEMSIWIFRRENVTYIFGIKKIYF